MPLPTLKELARSKGKNLRQVGLAGAYASMINRGHRAAGPEAISTLAAALGESPEHIAAICDACLQAAAARRAVASTPAMSPEAASPHSVVG